MPSFDAVSEVDLQEVDNAINQTTKEILTRYDFKGSKSSVAFDKTKKLITMLGDDDYKIKAIVDIFQNKAVKRGLSLKSFDIGEAKDATGASKRVEVKLVMGIEQDKAKEIIRAIKDSKMKVQAQIQDEKVRVTGKKRDDLQEAIALLQSKDFGIPLQFENFRD